MYIDPTKCWDASMQSANMSELLAKLKANDEKLEKIEEQKSKKIELEVNIEDETLLSQQYKKDRLLDLTA